MYGCVDDVCNYTHILFYSRTVRMISMQMKHDGVDIYCLPDGAKCRADDEGRSPLEIDECPEGNEYCSGDCYYYTEED